MTRPYWTLLWVVTLLSIAGQYIGVEEHSRGWWEKVPGFWAMFGFAGCLLLIGVARAAGRYWLERKEDPYDEL